MNDNNPKLIYGSSTVNIEHQSLRKNDETNLMLLRPQPWKAGIVPYCFDEDYEGKDLFRRVSKRIPYVNFKKDCDTTPRV